MSQQCCSGTKKENLLSACTNLHIAISKEVKHTDLKVGPWVWAPTLKDLSKRLAFWKTCWNNILAKAFLSQAFSKHGSACYEAELSLMKWVKMSSPDSRVLNLQQMTCVLGKEDLKENGHYFLIFEDVLDMSWVLPSRVYVFDCIPPIWVIQNIETQLIFWAGMMGK